MSAESTGVVVIGDGVIGLSTAFELGRAGVHCRVLGAVNHGAASGAAAGLLAPSVGTLRPDVQRFFDASLGLYPGFVDELRAFEPQLVLLEGLIDVSRPPDVVPSSFPNVIPSEARDRSAPNVIPSSFPNVIPSEARDRSAPNVIPSEARDRSAPNVIPSEARDRFLSAADLAVLEPALAPAAGVFHPRDGAIDNGLLTRALRRAVVRSPTCRISEDPAVAIDPRRFTVTTRSGATIQSDAIVVAAGAWSPAIGGLPRPIPVVPLKGQMLSVSSSALHHPVMGEDIYLVPRRTEIAIGATAEHAGFDTTVFPEAIERLRQSAIAVCPALADAPVLRAWAGIRPATPDMLPILGPDPDYPRLFYACGHSKNGILLAPATARCIAALATQKKPPLDVSPFRIERLFPSNLS